MLFAAVFYQGVRTIVPIEVSLQNISIRETPADVRVRVRRRVVAIQVPEACIRGVVPVTASIEDDTGPRRTPDRQPAGTIALCFVFVCLRVFPSKGEGSPF